MFRQTGKKPCKGQQISALARLQQWARRRQVHCIVSLSVSSFAAHALISPSIKKYKRHKKLSQGKDSGASPASDAGRTMPGMQAAQRRHSAMPGLSQQLTANGGDPPRALQVSDLQ